MFGFRGKPKPKDTHSLDNLKYLYAVLVRHQNVTESNRSLLVETLRSISEILIWGDQNDGTVFDYFLEKNMLSFFIQYMEQQYGKYVSVQLLQTLNILFENISNETSIYYLLSNNHVNAIIKHPFDFHDEEVMAYYISFMKTISLKLNKHTIHFFFNEQSADFPLYTEALKFFNHSESMVRIAVRTITLNVYQVHDTKMQIYIQESTAHSYFSQLISYMCQHVLQLDRCVRNDVQHKNKDRLADLVAEHLDHVHYLNDVLCLGSRLSDILTDLLISRMYLPLYINSMIPRSTDSNTASEATTDEHIESTVAFFLLSQVLLVMKYKPLVNRLTDLLLGPMKPSNLPKIEGSSPSPHSKGEHSSAEELRSPVNREAQNAAEPGKSVEGITVTPENITDDEKLTSTVEFTIEPASQSDELTQTIIQSERLSQTKPYLNALCSASVTDDDYVTLLATCCLYGLINADSASDKLNHLDTPQRDNGYNELVASRLMHTIVQSGEPVCSVRLATLDLTIMTLKRLVDTRLADHHLATIISVQERVMERLRKTVRIEEMFLEIFEHEFRQVTKRSLNVEYLTMDESILLTPTATPLTGIELTKRYPCGEVERVRCAIRVFLHIWLLIRELYNDKSALPLVGSTNDDMRVGDIRDLNNSDLVGCMVVRDGSPQRRDRQFLVIDVTQIILVEPDANKLGWGVVKFCGFLQDVEVVGDKDDSRSLNITVHKQPSSHLATKPIPLLSAKLIFDDHIRCMAAKQRLTKGRVKARQRKMAIIFDMLEMGMDETTGHPGITSSFFNATKFPLPGKPVAQLPQDASNEARQSPPAVPVVSRSQMARALNSTASESCRTSLTASAEHTDLGTPDDNNDTMSIQLQEIVSSRLDA